VFNSRDARNIADDLSVGNAKVAGLAKDLHLEGQQYNVALSSFFISYALLEVPSNIILKLMRPSIWIAILMFCWGVVMTFVSQPSTGITLNN
jgi:hypothetical protein